MIETNEEYLKRRLRETEALLNRATTVFAEQMVNAIKCGNYDRAAWLLGNALVPYCNSHDRELPSFKIVEGDADGL